MAVTDKRISRTMDYAALLIEKKCPSTNPTALAVTVNPVIESLDYGCFVYRDTLFKPVIETCG